MKRIRVMIVEDSSVVRALLEHITGLDPRLEVCAAVSSAEHALQILDDTAPDVIAMDIRLPGMNGLEATRLIMSNKPVPIVVVASNVEAGTRNSIPMEALRAGALTVIEKPVSTTNSSYDALARHLCTQLVIMSQVKLVRQHTNYLTNPAGVWQYQDGGTDELTMVGIVCSTGGPAALTQLLTTLGPRFPLPILLVQHMTAAFLAGFAAWLETVCPFSVTVVDHRSLTIPVAGRIYMAPPECHLRLVGGRLQIDDDHPVSFQRPSGTVLFQSMARDLGSSALGVLLTGMGDDGASGLLELRRSGGYTLAEDQSTAVVYGMPAVAVRLGAVCESLPLPAIATRILELVSCRKKELRQ